MYRAGRLDPDKYHNIGPLRVGGRKYSVEHTVRHATPPPPKLGRANCQCVWNATTFSLGGRGVGLSPSAHIRYCIQAQTNKKTTNTIGVCLTRDF